MEDLYRNKWRIFALVICSTFITSFDATMVNVILPTVSIEFQADINTVQWVPGLHRLMITSLLISYGKLGDKFGHTRLLLVGLIAWVFFSAIAGFSQNIYQLIFFRGLQGVAAGMKIAVGYAIITAAFPPQERGKALGFLSSGIGVGTGVGPALGGVITDFLNWRFLFFVEAAVALTIFLWALRSIPKEKGASETAFDPAGSAGIFAFLFSLILWVSQGRAWGWTSLSSLSLLAFVLISGFALVWIERRVPHPLLRLSYFSNLTLTFGTIASFFNYLAQYMQYFLTPFYLQFVLGKSPSTTGLVMAALPVATLVVAPMSGILSDRIGSKPLMLAGTTLCTLALLSLSRLDAYSSPLEVATGLAFFGLGAACFNIPNQNAVMSSIGKEGLGVASSILTLGRNVGWTMGIAAAATMLSGQALKYQSPEQAGPLLSSVKVAYLLAACLSALAILASYLSSRARRRR